MINSNVNRCEEIYVRSIYLIKLSLFKYNTSEKFINILIICEVSILDDIPYILALVYYLDRALGDLIPYLDVYVI